MNRYDRPLAAAGARPGRPVLRAGCRAAALAVTILLPTLAAAATLVHKDGRVIKGSLAPVAGTVENPAARVPEGVADNRPVVLIDDQLRRVFLPKKLIQEFVEIDSGEPPERFRPRQRIAQSGARVIAAGPIVRTTPFDEFGRRILEMATQDGTVAIVQGITEITPEFVKVEALDVEGKNYVWDMRIATSSLPRETLAAILARLIDTGNIDHRLKIVRLYLQSDRYGDAEAELQQIVADFPEQKAAFAGTVVKIHQAHARRILAEIDLRRSAGQHNLALAMLNHFPTDNVAGETLQAVRDLIQRYKVDYDRGTSLLKKFDELIGMLKTTPEKERVKPIRDELFAELNMNTLDRLTAFSQVADSGEMSTEEKLALAISGWLVGSNTATRNLAVALSLYDTRELVRQYLREPVRLNREPILAALRSQEGAAPQYVAAILAHLKPPLAEDNAQAELPGFYALDVDGLPGEAPVAYYVQLPPEYDPYRRYPTIVTLHGGFTTAQQQLDWWAGAADEKGQRLGHAGRQGYIVVAPVWAEEHQRAYGYSAREHATVLNALRDACRRFSIDTDRVYLSGHSIGGDAAWDIGVAHPDLWAGVIPIAAQADKYVAHYRSNARYVPLYLISGELDGDKTKKNSTDVDYYLRGGYNVTAVQYKGRGHEHFSDEILQVFDWMGRYRRTAAPKQIDDVRTFRPWDNYFWWVELGDLPARAIVEPKDWPPPRNVSRVGTTATVNANNGINISTNAGKVTIWLSPEVIDLQQRTAITVKGSRLRANVPFIEPSVAVMLEDARTRADRLHAFWAKVEMPEGRINSLGE